MKLKRLILAAMAMALVLGTSGCGENQIPEITDDQARAIGEFVAFTMMKYDTGHRSRLMDLSESAYVSGSQPPQPSATNAPEEEEPSGMGPVDDTPVVDSSDTGIGGGNTYSMEEAMGLPEGVTITFRGQTVCDSYPNDSDSMAGTISVDAASGKKLLVLQFGLTNTTEQKIAVDLSSSEARYRVTVNGDHARWTLTTAGLPDDMASFRDTLPAGGSAEVVLIVEVEESAAAEISSISLGVKNESKIYTIQLIG